MTALNFFVNLMTMCSTYINAFISIVFSTAALYIPFCILVGCGFIGIVYKLIKG